jgi:hypothetical protein
MQFVYQVLHHQLFTKIEKALRFKSILSTFVDIQEAFDNTGFESLRAAAVSRQIDPELEQILNLTKTVIKTRTGILTGHSGLRYHMNRIGYALEDTCRMCMEESETTQHVMCECPAIAGIRLERFGKGFMSLQTVKSLNQKTNLVS